MVARKGRIAVLGGLAVMMAIVLLVAAACGDDATSTPVVVKETVEVTKVVEVTKEVPVKETVEVTKEVTVRETVVVTPTPQPTATLTPIRPQGKVAVAVPGFGKDVLDKSLSTGLELVYLGAMYDYFIGADEDGIPSFDLGILNSLDTTDGQVYTVTLKQGALWHDRVAITSEDLKFSMEYYARGEASCVGCGLLGASLDNVEIVDQYTAKIHLTSPNITFIPNMGPLEADMTILPKHHYDKVGIDGGFEDDPLGSGPFKFVDRNIGEFYEFEANGDYWDESRTPTYATLKVIVAAEATTRTALMRTGGADIAEIDTADVNLMVDRGFRINGPESVGTAMFAFLRSFEPDQLANKLEFRKALIQAVNWDGIARAFYPAGTEEIEVGTPLFSPVALGYDPSLPLYPFDPDGAKVLLEQSGYAGEKVTLWSWATTGNPAGLDVAQTITSSWRDIGIETEIVPIELGGFIGRVRAGPPQDFPGEVNVTVTSPSARPSMLTNIRIFMNGRDDGGLIEGYHDLDFIGSAYNELVTIVDIDERAQKLQELNRAVYDTYWAAAIATRPTPYAVGERIDDWRPGDGAPTNLRWETVTLK